MVASPNFFSRIGVGSYDVSPGSVVRNLGSWFDSKLTMSTHISKVCASSFYHLHNIKRIRKYLSVEATQTLVHALITSRVDYCNSLLFGLPDCQLNKLQRVLNVSARLIYKLPRFCHITPILCDLHWLPIRYRINFKIILLKWYCDENHIFPIEPILKHKQVACMTRKMLFTILKYLFSFQIYLSF